MDCPVCQAPGMCICGAPTGRARAVFHAMPAEDRRNLAFLAFWLDPERERQDGEHLLGPEYTRLRHCGVIDTPFTSAAEGRPLVITDLGRAVLHYIEGGL